MSISLLDAVEQLIRNRPASLTYAMVADAVNEYDSNADCSAEDIKRIVVKRAEGMKVRKLQAIYETLAGKPLIQAS